SRLLLSSLSLSLSRLSHGQRRRRSPTGRNARQREGGDSCGGSCSDSGRRSGGGPAAGRRWWSGGGTRGGGTLPPLDLEGGHAAAARRQEEVVSRWRKEWQWWSPPLNFVKDSMLVKDFSDAFQCLLFCDLFDWGLGLILVMLVMFVV
ncbi:Os11g0434800, partial [Oryza sativa Japonica Group]